MLQRDYFIRILQEFAVAIALFLEKKEGRPEAERDRQLDDLYRQYVGPREVVRNLTPDELLTYAADQWPADERFDRLEMVAELLSAEASCKTGPQRELLLRRAYAVYDYVDANGNTFSIQRRAKMNRLRTACDTATKES